MSPELVADVLVAAVVSVAAVCDLAKGKVYNWLTYPAAAVGLAMGAVIGYTEGDILGGLGSHLAVCAAVFGVLMLTYMLGGMGGGDVKLMAAVAAFVGWPGGILTTLYAFIAGAVIGVAMVALRGRLGLMGRRLLAAVKLLPAPGVKPDEAVPESTQRVPFAVAVAVGTGWYLAEKAAGETLWDAVRDLM